MVKYIFILQTDILFDLSKMNVYRYLGRILLISEIDDIENKESNVLHSQT